MRKILMVAYIGLLSGISVAQPPVVVEGSNAPFRIVSYGDLNLATEEGQDRLTSRIRAAARDICLEKNIEQVKFTMARRQCYDTAVSTGLRQMRAAIAAKNGGVALAAVTLTVRGD